jgi:hypothetical protein
MKYLLVALAIVSVGCSRKVEVGTTPMTANTLSAREQSAGWTLLFDGASLNGWRVYRGQSQPGGWYVRDGSLRKDQGTDDIISEKEFGDFELAWDWKLSPGGNSGVFFRATEEYEAPYWSGPEYQLLDDAGGSGDAKSRLTSAASNYGLYGGPAGVVKAANEWNSSRIVAKGPHVEYWLNATKMLQYEIGSPEWEAKVKASKFGAWAHFGRAARGHISIQGDHPGTLEVRNIKIRELR